MRRMLGRIALALLAAGTLGACATIPERAWANGQAMTQSRGYAAVMSGNRSVRAYQALYSEANPLKARSSQVGAYRPFGEWW